MGWKTIVGTLQIKGWAFLLAFGCLFFGFRHTYWLWVMIPVCLAAGANWSDLCALAKKDNEVI